jgi:hypothetical protein
VKDTGLNVQIAVKMPRRYIVLPLKLISDAELAMI